MSDRHQTVFLRLAAECLDLLIAAQPALRDAFMLSLSAASALFDLHAVNSHFERVPVTGSVSVEMTFSVYLWFEAQDGGGSLSNPTTII